MVYFDKQSGKFRDLLLDAKASHITFLVVELEVGLRFARMAASQNGENRVKNTRLARVAYETVLRFLPKVTLESGESQAIDERLSTLRSELQALGERA